MLHWLRDRRRAEARKRPFPPEWEAFVRANVAHYCMLDDAERAELRAMIQVFLEEKHWEGCGGLDLTDEIRSPSPPRRVCCNWDFPMITTATWIRSSSILPQWCLPNAARVCSNVWIAR